MAPRERVASGSNDGAKDDDGRFVTPKDSRSGPDDLHLADASNAVVLYGFCIAVTAFLLAVGAALCLHCLSLATNLGLIITLIVLVVTRHFQILRSIKRVAVEAGVRGPGPNLSHLPAVHYLYVLGSGGHTTEMVALIRLSFRPKKNQHRRYIITHGDQHSQNREKDLENLIHESCPDGSGGTYDTFIVTRARKVYQSYITSIYSSLRCALDILAALTRIPAQRAGEANAAGFRFPHVIVTNGPGTGFIVGLMAHVLKILYLVPEDRFKIIFIETWARTHKLGLTGKLYSWTGITDLFVVQSETLSKIVGRPNIGNVNTLWTEACKGDGKGKVNKEK
ncbi:hypothetical protein VPNG_09430 [Cytospora leucostoma]|uniref:UDP-N-acetylglucosamine transferase subunit ALG14 n=1 Tax=Cytospora leucostoma TaxID=1230097 RepID=A0A423VPZ5_9PEZI|nr:hypothetical protein VPNG_09430 [Cytospora leucostoma]